MFEQNNMEGPPKNIRTLVFPHSGSAGPCLRRYDKVVHTRRNILEENRRGIYGVLICASRRRQVKKGVPDKAVHFPLPSHSSGIRPTFIATTYKGGQNVAEQNLDRSTRIQSNQTDQLGSIQIQDETYQSKAKRK